MSSIEVKLRRVGADSADIPLPRYLTPYSAGLDLYAVIPDAVTLAPGERTLIPTGIALEIPPDYEAQIRPRSGLAIKSGVTVLNSPGTIDADYRGEVGIVVINHGEYPVTIHRGERIAQMVFNMVAHARLVVVEELSPTDRGSGGFGSTGK